VERKLGSMILTGISQGKHKFSLKYEGSLDEETCTAHCDCGYKV